MRALVCCLSYICGQLRTVGNGKIYTFSLMFCRVRLAQVPHGQVGLIVQLLARRLAVFHRRLHRQQLAEGEARPTGRQQWDAGRGGAQVLPGGGVGRLERCLKRRQKPVQRQRGRGASGLMSTMPLKTRNKNQMTILKMKVTGGVLQVAWAAVKELPRQRQERVPQLVKQRHPLSRVALGTVLLQEGARAE